jgi:hypothetical protein
MKVANFIFYTLVGACITGMIYSNSIPNKTPQVSGSSVQVEQQ